MHDLCVFVFDSLYRIANPSLLLPNTDLTAIQGDVIVVCTHILSTVIIIIIFEQWRNSHDHDQKWHNIYPHTNTIRNI